MKRYVTISTLIAAILVLGSFRNQASAQPGSVAITYQDFYDGLSPHGEWMEYPEYGYVWRPTGIADFQPYSTGGRWVWTDEYDWMWVSDYDWGWAPFHYGRWFHDPFYGWMWVPGYEWAPAWVAWRHGGDYYGWAPLRPGIHIGINFNFGGYNPPIDYWSFAPRRYITSPRLWNYCLPRRQNVTIINNTTIINNYGRRGGNVFVTGPRRGDVERYTGRIRSVRFRESRAPGRTQFRRNEVSVYRPQIRQDNDRRFAPRQFNRVESGNAGRDNNIRRPDNRLDNRLRNDRNVRENRIERRPTERNPRIMDNRRNTENNRIERRQPQRVERREQPERIERRQPQRVERREQPARIERRQPQRVERREQPARIERRQPQRVERREQPARIERRQPQRVERREQPARIERRQPQRVERQQPQRVERQQPARMERRSPASDNRSERRRGN
jgi:hypothetical protein